MNEHEQQKKRAYNHRVMEVEHGTFTPLIFTIHGTTSTECTILHNNLAEKIANKTGEEYSKVLTLIRCKLSFLILRAALLCLRGSRTVNNQLSIVNDDFSKSAYFMSA